MTDRQFDKRLALLEKRQTLLDKRMGDLAGAMLVMSETFVTFTQFLSSFQRGKPPPNGKSQFQVGLN